MAYYTATGAARRLNRHERTIRRWIEQGRLKADYVTSRRFAIDESEVLRLLAETGEAQRLSLEMLENRVNYLESALTDFMAQQAARSVLFKQAKAGQDTGPRPARHSTEPLISRGDLPPGSMKAHEFARLHGVNPRNFKYHLVHGMAGERIDYLATQKPGRLREVERWLSPSQQELARAFWTRHGIAYQQQEGVNHGTEA